MAVDARNGSKPALRARPWSPRSRARGAGPPMCSCPARSCRRPAAGQRNVSPDTTRSTHAPEAPLVEIPAREGRPRQCRRRPLQARRRRASRPRAACSETRTSRRAARAPPAGRRRSTACPRRGRSSRAPGGEQGAGCQNRTSHCLRFVLGVCGTWLRALSASESWRLHELCCCRFCSSSARAASRSSSACRPAIRSVSAPRSASAPSRVRTRSSTAAACPIMPAWQ
eukprot:1037723-Rhodomonas_salina.4